MTITVRGRGAECADDVVVPCAEGRPGRRDRTGAVVFKHARPNAAPHRGPLPGQLVRAWELGRTPRRVPQERSRRSRGFGASNKPFRGHATTQRLRRIRESGGRTARSRGAARLEPGTSAVDHVRTLSIPGRARACRKWRGDRSRLHESLSGVGHLVHRLQPAHSGPSRTRLAARSVQGVVLRPSDGHFIPTLKRRWPARQGVCIDAASSFA